MNSSGSLIGSKVNKNTKNEMFEMVFFIKPHKSCFLKLLRIKYYKQVGKVKVESK